MVFAVESEKKVLMLENIVFSAGFLGGILDKSHVHVKAKSRVRFRGEIIFSYKIWSFI